MLGAAVFSFFFLHIELYYTSQLLHVVGVHIARLSAIDSFLRVMGPKLEAHAFTYILQEQVMATMLWMQSAELRYTGQFSVAD